MSSGQRRVRIRELIPKLPLGPFPTGPHNAITDVPGVLVSTQEIIKPANPPEHKAINTGVTVVLPRKDFIAKACHAGIFRFNGAGELTGSHWLEETGLLASPIVLTGTLGIGAAHEGVIRHLINAKGSRDEKGLVKWFMLPVVSETWDGGLTDAGALPVRPAHVVEGIEQAKEGPVREGNAGGGTAMVCHQVKGGTGTASRKVFAPEGWKGMKRGEHSFVLGALVQANYGVLKDLRIGGVPIGLQLEKERKGKETSGNGDGSIVIIIATDAPLMPLQLQRIARRATSGLSRVGGFGHNYSGDLFLAFSTAAEIAMGATRSEQRPILPADMLNDDELGSLFEATADVVEEAIYNAICMAETTTGPAGNVVEALDLAKVKELVEPRLLIVE